MIEKKRHIAKTISYRIISSLSGMILVWMISKDIYLSLSFSLVEFIYKPLQYYIHERVWYNYIKYGIKNQ